MQQFSRQNEEPDNSINVTFEPAVVHPPLKSVVSCAVFVGKDGKYVLAQHPSGWDLPSLVRADSEEPEACAYRIAEAMGVNITEPELVGQWVLRKNFDSPLNEALPDVSYQLLYIATVTHEGAFTPSNEFNDRAIVGESEVSTLHRNPDNFRDIFEYARERFNRIP